MSSKKKTPKKPITQKQLSVFLLSVIFLIVCIHYFKEDEDSVVIVADAQFTLPDSLKERGRLLAARHCKSCHMVPDPGMLNKENWQKILPRMGYRLGIKSHKGQSYEWGIPPEDNGFYPANAAMSTDDWQDILDYYLTVAPDILPRQNKSVQIKRELPFFSVIQPPGFFRRAKMMVSYVKIDNSVKPARVFAFERFSSQLFLLNNKLDVLDSIYIKGVIVDISFHKKQMLACSIGDRLSVRSDDEKTGSIFPITVNSKGKLEVESPIFKELHRPVQITAVDLNKDNLTDYVLCEFGKLTGSLIWMENKGSGKFKRHLIRDFPGGVQVYVKDSETTGSKDLWVLFAQGDEGIFHFTNNGHGEFKTKQVLRFPANYGSTSFQMTDMNNDGSEDIVYTCGDNGDETDILKPYHGVYIFINDGRYNFSKQFFYPVNGCYKVIAGDFTHAANKDLAVIGFHVDDKQPEEGFVFLKNDGNLKFSAYALSPELKFERVLTMNSGDLDGNGSEDLILGNAFEIRGPFGYNLKEPFFIALKNSK